MKPENVRCPKCGGSMQSRVHRRSLQRFWGCVHYPTCRGTRDTDGLSRAERVASTTRALGVADEPERDGTP